MKHPTQAVIFAGGFGSRLCPLTTTVPKPMIRFHGRPFLHFLIMQLKAEGFSNILLLTGHLSHVIDEYVSTADFGAIEVNCFPTLPEEKTSARLRKVAHLLDDVFFLMYCDNYLPYKFELMWEQFQKSGLEAQVTVYTNPTIKTKNNVFHKEGLVINYDKSRKDENLNGVEAGFAIFKKDVVNLLKDETLPFESNVYSYMASRRELGAFVTKHSYFSVGDFARLPETYSFLSFRPTILLDRDGVLNLKAPKAHYITRPEDFKWIDGSLKAIALLTQAGFQVAVITNQAGIARGIFDEQTLAHIHGKMKYDVLCSGGRIDAVYYCPHHWDEGCSCRKPEPGMLYQAQREMCFDLSRAWFVGDDERDLEAGRRAGCPTFLVDDKRLLIDVVQEIIIPETQKMGQPL